MREVLRLAGHACNVPLRVADASKKIPGLTREEYCCRGHK